MSKKSSTAPEAIRFDAFSVREYEAGGETKHEWLKVGTAWPHQDGKGFRVVLTATPVDGVVVLRAIEPKAD